MHWCKLIGVIVHNVVSATRPWATKERKEDEWLYRSATSINIGQGDIYWPERISRMDCTMATASMSTIWRNVLASAGCVIGGREESVCFLETGEISSKSICRKPVTHLSNHQET